MTLDFYRSPDPDLDTSERDLIEDELRAEDRRFRPGVSREVPADYFEHREES